MRRPRPCARRTSTRCSLSSTRASSAAASRRARGTGCWRRSASSRPPSSKRQARPTLWRRHHAEFFAAFAGRAAPHLRHGPDQQGWVERVAADYDNVRAAMNFALDHDLTLALRLVGRVTFFIWLRGGFAEARAWLDAILPRAAGQPQDLLGWARSVRPGSPSPSATPRAKLDIPTRPTQRSPPSGMSKEWPTRFGSAERPPRPAVMPCRQSDLQELAELAERIGDRWNGAIALNNLGDTANQSGDWERAVELCGQQRLTPRARGRMGDGACALQRRIRRDSARKALVRRSDLRVALETNMKIDAKTVVNFCLDVSVELAVAREGSTTRHVSLGRLRDCRRSSARPGDSYEETGSSDRSNPFASARRRHGRGDPAWAGAVARRVGGARAHRTGDPD